MKKTIIFCQSLGDIIYASQIADTLVNPTVFINQSSVYENSIELGVFKSSNIIFLPYPRGFLNLIKFKFKYLKLIKKLKNESFEDAYFFSLGFDWISLSVIAHMKNCFSNIFYFDYYKNVNEKNIYFLRIDKLARSIYYFSMTGIWFSNFTEINKRAVVFLKKKNLNLKQLKNLNKLELKRINLYKPNYITKKTVLFVDSPLPFSENNIDIQLLKEIFKNLQAQGFNLMLKKHPRINRSSIIFLDELKLIENYPIEFIDISLFKFVFGFGSAALIKNNCENKISLNNIFLNNENLIEMNRSNLHLKNLDKSNQLITPSSMFEFNEFIKTL